MMTKDLDTYLAELEGTPEPAVPPGMRDRIWIRIAARQDRLSARRATAMGGGLVAGALLVGVIMPVGNPPPGPETELFASDFSQAPSVLLDAGL